VAQYEKLINLSLLSEFLTKAKTIFAPKITASGILKGDGSGGVSVATAGTDYATPAQVNAKYTKPSGGIPDSDIASASTWNAKGTYNKPSGGIPDTDIASASTWNAKASTTSVPASASVDASTGVMSFKNSGGTQLFTVTLPKYNGEVV
jgi:hypothetical protein